jgi:hypothetical protein
MSVIMHLLKEGRISFYDPDGGTLRCESCGKPIGTGRFCEACKDMFVDKIQSLVPPLGEAAKTPSAANAAGGKGQVKMHIMPGGKGGKKL